MNQEEQMEQEQGGDPQAQKQMEMQESIDPNLERQVSFYSIYFNFHTDFELRYGDQLSFCSLTVNLLPSFVACFDNLVIPSFVDTKTDNN